MAFAIEIHCSRRGFRQAILARALLANAHGHVDATPMGITETTHGEQRDNAPSIATT